MINYAIYTPIIAYVFIILSNNLPTFQSYCLSILCAWGVAVNPFALFMSIITQHILGIEFLSHYRERYSSIKDAFSDMFQVYGADKINELLSRITNSMLAWQLLLFQSYLIRKHHPDLLGGDKKRTMDIDVVTVISFASNREGAEPGYNRKYKGKPCLQLSCSYIGNVFVDCKLFPGSDNPKGFFQKAIKRAIALGYRPGIIRADTAYLAIDNIKFMNKLSLDYAVGASGSFNVVKQGKKLFKQLARKKHRSIIPIAKGVSGLDLGIVTIEKGVETRIVVIRRITRRKNRKTGKYKIRTYYYSIATSLELSVPKLYSFYHKRQCIESGFKELKKHYHLERLPVANLKGNEFWVVCKILARTLVKMFQVEMLPESCRSMMRGTLLRKLFEKGFTIDEHQKVQIRPKAKYVWLLRRLIGKLDRMKLGLSP
jgi:hypothetical protein